MAISYVGGKVGTASGSTTTDITIALDSGLTGGSGTGVSTDDLVIVTVSLAHSDDASTADLVTADYTALTQLDSNDTRDTALQVHYKFMGATPDTSVVIARSGHIENSIAWTVQVFAGVDTTTPMDVTPTTATGIDTDLADPAAIEPVTTGAWITIHAGANSSGTAVMTWSVDFEDTLSAHASDTQDAVVGSAYYSGWTSGSYDPAATSTGSDSTFSSWCAYTLALRPSTGGVTTGAISGAGTGSVTWGASSTATSAASASSAAVLTMTGAAVSTADLSASAVASVTWAGAEVLGAALSASAAATLEWEGVAATLAASAWSASATAVLEAAGASTASSDWNADAAAALTAAGSSIASGDWTSAAAATLTVSGSAEASAAWSADALASATFTGVAFEQTGSDWYMTATAELTAAGAAVASAAASMEASASAAFVGIDASAVVERDLNGWEFARIRREQLDEIDEEDILVLTTALYTYLEQSNGYH